MPLVWPGDYFTLQSSVYLHLQPESVPTTELKCVMGLGTEDKSNAQLDGRCLSQQTGTILTVPPGFIWEEQSCVKPVSFINECMHVCQRFANFYSLTHQK